MSWVTWALGGTVLLLGAFDWILRSDAKWYAKHPGAEEEFARTDLELSMQKEERRNRVIREREKEKMRQKGWVFPED